MLPMMDTVLDPRFVSDASFQYFPSDAFPIVEPLPPHDWLRSHFAVGGWSRLRRLSGMLTAHMTSIAPHNGFTWHPHRGLEIYTWVLEGQVYHEDTTGGKGFIGPGELQRMFSGDWIEHQELNRHDTTARVIQIWFVTDGQYRQLPPHYQQIGHDRLPARRVGDANVVSLIGDDSPMESHVRARLTATTVGPKGTTILQPPAEGEDLFLYVTDGKGEAVNNQYLAELGQYDVILARPDILETCISTGDQPLHFLSFYLPRFLD